MAIPPPWALHVDGSNCFNRLTTIALTGSVTADNTARVACINIPYIANQLNGTFTSSAQGTFNLAGDIAQSAAPALKLALTSPELSPSTRPAIQARSSPH
jgi:hypothetical protein